MVMMVTRRQLEDGDFDAWCERFAGGVDARREVGCRGVRRFRAIDDPRELFVLFEWDDLEAARSFVSEKMNGDPKLAELRENGAPKMESIFVEELPPLPS